MTATRMVRAATLVVLAAGWLVAAALLWHTSVPPSVDAGGLDVHRFFSARELAGSSRYSRFVDALWAMHLLATLVALAILARRAPRLARSIALGRVGTGVIIASIVVVTLWCVSLPFGLAHEWWDARHGLAPSRYGALVIHAFAALAIQALVAIVVVSLVLGLARTLGDRWWLAGAPVFVVATAALIFGYGYSAELGAHSIRAAWLREDVRALERAEDVPGTPVRVARVSDTTHEANAFANGFGPSANVVLWDTVLQKPFDRQEARVVLAHELGHVHHRHVLKGVGWAALVIPPLAWLLTVAARRRGGIADPAALPFVLLALVVAGFVAAPLVNVVSRRYEAEADWSALEATRDPAAARRLFVDFQRTSLQQPDPPTWEYLWLENHPTIAQRLAMVDAWIRWTARPSPAGS